MGMVRCYKLAGKQHLFLGLFFLERTSAERAGRAGTEAAAGARAARAANDWSREWWSRDSTFFC